MKNTINSKKTKILLIGGWGRSGSTILGKILGQTNRFFLSGETRFFWKRRLTDDWKCGCGLLLQDCDIWQDIIKQANFSNKVILDTANYFNHLKAKNTFTYNLSVTNNTIAKNHVLNLYQNISNITGADVIIDTSKHPAYVQMLNQISELDVYLVHLVRDPRGTANSWNKTEVVSQNGESVLMRQYSFLASTLQWIFWNFLYESIKTQFNERYLFIRYEDFINTPQSSLKKIFDLIKEPYHEAIESDNSVQLNITHAISGNPNRFDTGVVKLKLDSHWKSKMPFYQKLLIGMITLPLLLKYKYPLTG